MCLYVISERLIADEDIICYKQIMEVFNEELIQNNYKEAEEFSGKIHNVQCNGKIHYENDNVYFCTNEKLLDGSYCKNKLGYKYSWVLDNFVTKLNKAIVEYYTPYQHMNVELGKIYNGKLEEPNNNNEINIGFHAYTIKQSRCNVKCVIPKDSEYYLGDCNEIVSNCIKYEKLL